MGENQLFNISESLREDTSNLFLNQPPQHMGDSCCEEEIEDNEQDLIHYPNESFIKGLQKSFKSSRSVPIHLLSSLSTDGQRHLIEYLIQESLKFNRESRKSATSSDSDSNFSSNSIHKQTTFPTFRPVLNDELKIRRNNNISTYQKVEVCANSSESYSIVPISVKLPQPEQHDQTVLKLVHEISEGRNMRNMLLQVIRLSPNKFKLSSQITQIVAKVNKHKKVFSGLLQESGKVKIFAQLMNFNKKQRKKLPASPSEHEAALLKQLIDIYDSQNVRNFRGFAYGLMKEHEPSEIARVLIKHACWVEINTFGEMLLKVACLKKVLETQENVLTQVKALNLNRIEGLKDLQNFIKNFN